MPDSTRRFRDAVAESRSLLLNEAGLQRTIDRLHTDGEISCQQAASLRNNLPVTLQNSEYVLKHLGVHLGIGAVFAFDVIPLPLGTICRVLWVLGNRLYESLRGEAERAHVHALGVLMIAAIPIVGYGAYLLPLRRASEGAAYLYANHLAYLRSGQSLAAALANKPKVFRRVAAWFVRGVAE